jgi:hypothetical protein
MNAAMSRNPLAQGDVLAPFGGVLPRGDRAALRAWALPGSLALHAFLLLVLALWTAVRPMEPPPTGSIDVQIVSAPEAKAAEPPPVLPGAATDSPLPAAAPAAPQTRPQPTEPEGDGMIRPSHFLAAGLLKEATSREVRNTLPRLAPFERVTQLCNIEATEQIQATYPITLPDTVVASAMGDTTVTGNNIVAPHAAFRSRRRWFAVSFVCTVAPDYQSVTDFRFKVGDPIPQAEWASHNLNAVDADE